MQSETKPSGQREVSVMSEEEGQLKGVWPVELKLLQHLSGFRQTRGSIVQGSSTPVGNSRVKGFNTNPSEFSRDLISRVTASPW